MRYAVASGISVVTAWALLALTAAPPLVDVLSLICLAVGLWVPAMLIARERSDRRFHLTGLLLMPASIFLWDALAHFFLVDTPAFRVLREMPMLYVLGTAGLAFLVALSSMLGQVARSATAPRRA